ncbi:uncharacterized PE-PGRS family protein PE_PGRS46-like [Hibiscus syriacus]|uniref:uncharacterized PE-PGRS family protein PE_PGRS46-like n=1 Tax=Hibiscus syriacus TaxID=106335 RepID=UPI001920D038|nr:uncharacterized PE-PGRS family protein PE_PGRS46-like [Hibiscus syriacus]
MGRVFAFLVLVLVVLLHASNARNVPPGDDSMEEQTLRAGAAQADSPKSSGVDDKKNFIYGGVGGFAGVGGYGGMAGGIPLVGGLGGIGKFGVIGGAAGIGGYTGIGGLGGLGSGTGGGVGPGGASGLGGAFPSPDVLASHVYVGDV